MKINKSLLLLSISITLSGCSTIGSSIDALTPTQPTLTAAQKDQKRAAILKVRDDTLAQLYTQKPETKNELQQAAGYGVFEGRQVNVLLVLGSLGDGVLVDNDSGQNTYMSLDKIGTGPGVGYKTYRQVVIFKSKKLLEKFRSIGADVSASADATAKIDGKGGSALDGSISFDPNLSVYQFTDQGVLLQANWGGVMYKPDAQLNTPD
ncbi:lipid-binding SYLF domain-containing protein [Glaciimonas soli]|uniref:Lipid-binding SYLF domain-containing protein n=1 Tax=Glaciimonas soli TaxID=2590999 RepID=A0A843YPK8_9BURK|nr:hypothetical protein [Glaciimonas soli]MQR01739.1 hypothetical protein [Glaciimonas soli]